MKNNPGHKIRVMHITHGLGGIQTYLEYILRYSDRETFEYIIVAPYNTAFQSFCNGMATYCPLKINREISVFSDLFMLIRLIRLVRKEKPQVLHVHSAKGGFLGRLAGLFFKAKVIYTPHGFSYLSFTGKKRMFFFMLESMARNWSDTLLAVSHSEANRAIFELGYRAGKVKVILNSIYPGAHLIERDYAVNYRIGMIGRLTYQKNPLLFLEIAKTLLSTYPQLQFNILGAGLNDHLGNTLQDFIHTNNLQQKVQLLPWGSSDTSRDFLAHTDIYVMTSVFEGLPFSLLEALDSECACVVSKADGNTDVIQNGENGFACLSKEEFCNSISLLIESRPLREAFGHAGRQYVLNRHHITQAIAQLQSLYLS